MMNVPFKKAVYESMDFFCEQLAKQMIYQERKTIENELDQDILTISKQLNENPNPPKQKKISTSSIKSDNNNINSNTLKNEFSKSEKFLIRKSNTKTGISYFANRKFHNTNIKKNTDTNLLKKIFHSENENKKHDSDNNLEVEIVPISESGKKISNNKINKSNISNNKDNTSLKEEKNKKSKINKSHENNKDKNNNNISNSNENQKNLNHSINLVQIISGSEESDKINSKNNSNKDDLININNLNKISNFKSTKNIKKNNISNNNNLINPYNFKNNNNTDKNNINEIDQSKNDLMRHSGKIFTLFGRNNIFQKPPSKKESKEQAKTNHKTTKSKTNEHQSKINHYSDIISKLSKSFRSKKNNVNNNMIETEEIPENDTIILPNNSTQLVFDYYINSKTTKKKMNFIEKQIIRQKFKEKSIKKMKANLEKKNMSFIFKPHLDPKSLKIAKQKKNPPLFKRAVEMENSKVIKILMNESKKKNIEIISNSNSNNSKKTLQQINDFFYSQMEWKEKVKKKVNNFKDNLISKDNQEFSEILSHKFQIDPYSKILINKSTSKDHQNKNRNNYFSLFNEYNQNSKCNKKYNSFTRLYEEREIRELKLKKLKKQLTPNFRPAVNNDSPNIKKNYIFNTKSFINSNNIIKRPKSYIFNSINSKSGINNISLNNNNLSISKSLSPILENDKTKTNNIISKKNEIESVLSPNINTNNIKSRNIIKRTSSKNIQSKNTGFLNMTSTSVDSKNNLFKYTNKNINNNETFNSNTKINDGKSNITNIIEEETSSFNKVSSKNLKNKNSSSIEKLDKSKSSDSKPPTMRKNIFENKISEETKEKRVSYLLDNELTNKLKNEFQKDNNYDFSKINSIFLQNNSPQQNPRGSRQAPRKSALKKSSNITEYQTKKNVTVFEDNIKTEKKEKTVKLEKSPNPRKDKTEIKDKNDKTNEDNNLTRKKIQSKKIYGRKTNIYEGKIIDSTLMNITKKEKNNENKTELSIRKLKTARGGINDSKIILHNMDKSSNSNESISGKVSSSIFSSDKDINSKNLIIDQNLLSNKNMLKSDSPDKKEETNRKNEKNDSKNNIDDEEEKEDESEINENNDETKKNENSWIKKLAIIAKNEKIKSKNERNDFEKLYMLNVRNNTSTGNINPFTITANKGIFYKFFSKHK